MRNAILSFLFLLGPVLSQAQVNDLCSTVTPEALDVGSTLVWTGDNTGATFTDDFVPGSVLGGFNNPAVWHAFTTTECADVTIDYCGTTPAFGEYWNVVATTCPAGNAFVPTQQTNMTECGDGNPTSRFLGLPAGTYYYPVWTEAGVSEGPYTINVTATTCGGSSAANDDCGALTPEALAVGGSLTLVGDNTFATSTGDFAAGSPFAGAPVVWHSFTLSECAKVTLSYCGLDPIWTNTFGFLARDCPASDLVYFSSYNDIDCVDGDRTYIFNQLAAGTYNVPVLLDANDNAVGPYELQLQAEACPTQPTFYNFCSQVQYQPLGIGASLTFIGDNTNATGNGDFVAGSPFEGAPVVWHGFTTTTCATVTVAYCGQAPVWGNTFGILGTECPVATPIYFTSFDNTSCVDGNRTYVFSALPPGSYLVPVVLDAVNNAIGPYTIQVSSVACPAVPPANNNCGNVAAEALSIGAPLTFSGDNTFATSSGDFVPGSPFVAAPVVWHAFTTAECVDLVLSYCGQDPVWANTLGFLVTACPGDVPIYFSTTNNTSCPEGNATYFFNDLQPGTYYVPVLRDAANSAIGPYNVVARAENCLFLAEPEQEAPVLGLWPNPTTGNLSLSNLEGGDVLVQVLDATGRTVHTERASATRGGVLELSLNGTLVPGTYLLRIIAEKNNYRQRFVIR